MCRCTRPRATDVVSAQQDRLDGAHEVALLVGRHEIMEHDQALHGGTVWRDASGSP